MRIYIFSDIPECGHNSISSDVQELLTLDFEVQEPKPTLSIVRVEEESEVTLLLVLAQGIYLIIHAQDVIKIEAFTSRTICWYPRILVLHLNRVSYTLYYAPVLIAQKVEYKRYMTLFDGQDQREVYCELICFVIFKGSTTSIEHYYTYILNSDKKW